MVEILPSPSILFRNMVGSQLPIPIAHGEGRASFASIAKLHQARPLFAARYIDGTGRTATTYPANPNGSPEGITALTSADGRATIMMPHPERAFRAIQFSWHPDSWGEDGPWLRIFRNARQWVG